jgi:hypothetical protein
MYLLTIKRTVKYLGQNIDNAHIKEALCIDAILNFRYVVTYVRYVHSYVLICVGGGSFGSTFEHKKIHNG